MKVFLGQCQARLKFAFLDQKSCVKKFAGGELFKVIPRVVYSFFPGWSQHITTTAMKNWLQQWRELQRSKIQWHFSDFCSFMSNPWFFVQRGVQLVYDTVGGVELGRNSLKCLQFGGRLTILTERLFNSERSTVLPDTASWAGRPHQWPEVVVGLGRTMPLPTLFPPILSWWK